MAPISLRPAGIVAAPGLTGGPEAAEELLPAEDGAAEAVLFGATTEGLTIELVDVDAGVVKWRNLTAAASLRAFAGDVVIAGDDHRTIALDRATGIERWRVDGPFRARDQHTVAVATDAGLVFVDDATGNATAPMTTPDAWPAASVVAVCATPSLHAYAYRNGQLARWEVEGDALRLRWKVESWAPSRIDACAETYVFGGGDPRAVTALDPATGAVVGGPVEARDFWPARSGSGFELATTAGVEARDRRLGAARALERVSVGRMLASRGGRRVVARGDGGVVLLDEHGARALAEPYGAQRVALGDRYLVGGPWALPVRTFASRPTRYQLPRVDEEAAPQAPFGEWMIGDPPRIDLPVAAALPDGIALDGVGRWAVGAAFVDGNDPARIYVSVLEDRPSETRGAAIAAFDLAPVRGGGGTWTWHAPDACPPGMPVAMAATTRVVVCGARQLTPGTGVVRAVDRTDGRPLWDWHGVTVDTILAAGDTLLVTEGARAVVLDPASGSELASWRASDGWLPRVALVRARGDVVVASYEHGRIVLRSSTMSMRPIRSIAVNGVLTGLFAVGDKVVASLGDGTAYLIDTRGTAVAAAGLAPGWEVTGDRAATTTTDTTGADGVLATFSTDGVMRTAVTIPGSGPIAVVPRGNVDGAPLTVLGGPGFSTILALTPAGGTAALVELPPDAARTPVVATAVDGAGVVAAVLARPLRLVRIDLK
ncbi:MAG TPA: hypothetical protein VM261_07805 [Kofleriaceae bacterium]|nr:hypothetical protein [Kofleriaceae bacterium]